MRKLLIIGIGSGNPEHMTVQAINALNRADVLFIPT
ncbi:MAG: SAM-dependent methyltransferase, partial [Ensifer adhaerens]